MLRRTSFLIFLIISFILGACTTVLVPESGIQQFLLDFSEGLIYPNKVRSITLWFTATAAADLGNTRLIFEGCAEEVWDIHEKYFQDDPVKTFETWSVNADDLEMLVMLVGEHLYQKITPPVALGATLVHDGIGNDGHIVWEWHNNLPVLCDDQHPPFVIPPVPAKSNEITEVERAELFAEVNSFLEDDYTSRTYGDLPSSPQEVNQPDITGLIIPFGIILLLAALLVLRAFKRSPVQA